MNRYPILSRAALRDYGKLHLRKFRNTSGLFLAEGVRTVTELCRHLPDASMVEALLLTEEAMAGGVDFPVSCQRWISMISSCDSATLTQTSSAPGVFGVFRIPEQQPFVVRQASRSLVLALDEVQDPGNVGTMLRTAAWFGVDAMLCSPGTADRFNPKVVRACAGSLYALPHYGVPHLHAELERFKAEGFMVLAASLDGADVRDLLPAPAKTVLVIGNEANGISGPTREVADALVRIPHAGRDQAVESLNASVSAAILMERMVL